MARRPKASAPAPAARRGAAASDRETTARSRMAAPAKVVAEVEVVEEGRGLGIDEGIIILTTLFFLAAVLITDYARGVHYGEGLFFN
jgi:hypothetical protein